MGAARSLPAAGRSLDYPHRPRFPPNRPFNSTTPALSFPLGVLNPARSLRWASIRQVPKRKRLPRKGCFPLSKRSAPAQELRIATVTQPGRKHGRNGRSVSGNLSTSLALCQGTTEIVPKEQQNRLGFVPCGLLIRQENSGIYSHPFPQKTRKWMGHPDSI
jgi:hypothetical protein